jgi:hypothetical protein
VIRWLQTSLCGTAVDKVPAPAPSPQQADPSPDAALSRRWEEAGAGPDITLIPVPRLRQGWRLEWRRGALANGTARLRVPKVFTEAPDDILRALAAWARLAVQRKSPARRAERLALEKFLHAWIEARHAEDAHARKLAGRRAARREERLEPRGGHHDLEAVLAAVNAEYFGGALRARITWSRRWGGLSTQTTAHDAEGRPYALITVSRGYDHPSATPEIVGGVVYHECLHIAVPPEEKGGRRIVHGREFRRREREYRYYGEWIRWHREVLPGIIRRGEKPSGRGRRGRQGGKRT